MAKMNPRIKEMFEKQETIVLATATKGGVPNVVPVNAKKIIDDDIILISDQYFDKTLNNLKNNPRAAITIWDKFEGYQIKGAITIETSGKRFEETVQWIKEKGEALKFPLRSKGAVIFKITDIHIVSPGPDAGKKVC